MAKKGKDPGSDGPILTAGAMIDRDAPMTQVYHLDRMSDPPRLIRLEVKEALRWAYVTSIGDFNIAHAPEPIQTTDGWVCGVWFARK